MHFYYYYYYYYLILNKIINNNNTNFNTNIFLNRINLNFTKYHRIQVFIINFKLPNLFLLFSFSSISTTNKIKNILE
jgi:hypothetical protein